MTDCFPVQENHKEILLNQVVSFRQSKNISLIGLRKNRSEGQKQRVYDIENFDFSYSYNQEIEHDFEIENLLKKLLDWIAI